VIYLSNNNSATTDMYT